MISGTSTQFMMGIAVGLTVAFLVASFHNLNGVVPMHQQVPMQHVRPVGVEGETKLDFHERMHKEMEEMLTNFTMKRTNLDKDTHFHHGK